jgi:hypothetical protein
MPDKDAGTPRVFLVRHGTFMKSLLVLDRGVQNGRDSTMIATANRSLGDSLNLMPMCKRVTTVHFSPNLGGECFKAYAVFFSLSIF